MTSGLGLLLRGAADDNASANLKELTRRWNLIKPRSQAVRGYSIQSESTLTGAKTPVVADNTLAFAWIYGDVVHADSERRDHGAQFGVTERYRAAVPLVCQIMIQTINSLRFIRGLAGRGIIALPEGTWTTPVTTTETSYRRAGQVYLADWDEDHATNPPQIGEELGPEWEQLI